MTSPWAAPPQPTAGDEPPGPPLAADAVAATVTGVALVLLGAPVGLLWAAVAPRVRVGLGEQGGVAADQVDALLGADVAFGALVLAVGVVCGVLAFRLGRDHGPGVVVGLLLGGLVAAYVAARTGQQVDADAFRAAVEDATRQGTVEASVRLRATEVVVLWPSGALAAFAAVTAVRGPRDAVSSG